jgi:hypothetical protein
VGQIKPLLRRQNALAVLTGGHTSPSTNASSYTSHLLITLDSLPGITNTFSSRGPLHQLYRQIQMHLDLKSMKLMTLSSGWVMPTSTPPFIPCHLPHRNLSNILLHLHSPQHLLNVPLHLRSPQQLLNFLHHPLLKVTLPCPSPMCPTHPQPEQLKMR